MIVRTESGSRYEIDAAGMRARRLEGVEPATEMCASDWRAIIAVPFVRLGRPLLLVWDAPPNDPAAICRATLTSPVIERTP